MIKIKKFFAIILSVVFLLSSVSMTAFAFRDTKFNIEDITWNDIMTISNSDFRKLLIEFEKAYDPFNTYETEPITAIYEMSNDGASQPLWKSGDFNPKTGEFSETASHELITARACGILLSDKGFWGDEKNGSLLLALMLSLASVLPDRDDESDSIWIFEGHFYDPDDGDSYTGSKTNTAKTNVQKYYTAAKNDYLFRKELNIETIGRMVHYIQDACEPHHAANVISLGPLSNHYQFEAYADDNLNEYIDSLQTIFSSKYTWACGMRAEDLLHDAAVNAKKYIGLVDSGLLWEAIANETTRAAVTYTALLLYKLSLDAGIPLTK